MKKLLTVVLAAVLLTLAVAPAFAGDDPSTWKTMYVVSANGKPVNIRSGPGKNYQAWAPLPFGTKVRVIRSENGWSLCDVDGYSNPGWVMSKFLSKKKPDEQPIIVVIEEHVNFSGIKAVEHFQAMVNYPKSNYLSLRWAPSLNSKLIRRCFNGTVLTVIAQSKDWYQVIDEETGFGGFILRKYMDRVDDAVGAAA